MSLDIMHDRDAISQPKDLCMEMEVLWLGPRLRKKQAFEGLNYGLEVRESSRDSLFYKFG